MESGQKLTKVATARVGALRVLGIIFNWVETKDIHFLATSLLSGSSCRLQETAVKSSRKLDLGIQSYKVGHPRPAGLLSWIWWENWELVPKNKMSLEKIF